MKADEIFLNVPLETYVMIRQSTAAAREYGYLEVASLRHISLNSSLNSYLSLSEGNFILNFPISGVSGNKLRANQALSQASASPLD